MTKYVEKTTGKSTEYDKNWQAFQKELQSGNLNRYPGGYVGYHNGELVANSNKVEDVLKILEELEPDPSKRFVERSDFNPDESPFWNQPPEIPPEGKSGPVKEAQLNVGEMLTVKKIAKQAQLDIKRDKLTLNIDISKFSGQDTINDKPTFYSPNEWPTPVPTVISALMKLAPPKSTKHYDIHGDKITFTAKKAQSEPSFLRRLDGRLQNKIASGRSLTEADKNNILSNLGEA